MNIQEQSSTSRHSLKDIMMEQKTWLLSQKDEQLYLIDVIDNKYNITKFRSELMNQSYFANIRLKRQIEYTDRKVREMFFSYDIFKYSGVNLKFYSEFKYEELSSNLLSQNKDFQIKIPDLFENQSSQFTFKGYINKLSIKYSNKTNQLFDYDIQKYLQNIDQDLTKFGGSIHVNTIEIGSQGKYVSDTNNEENIIFDLGLDFQQLTNMSFNNIMIVTRFYQYIQPQKKIQLNIETPEKINKLILFLYDGIQINFKFKKKNNSILEILFANQYDLSKDISCIINNENPFLVYRIMNIQMLKTLLSQKEHVNRIIFIPKEHNEKNIDYYLRNAIEEFNKYRFEIIAFNKFIKEELVFSPDQAIVDLCI